MSLASRLYNEGPVPNLLPAVLWLVPFVMLSGEVVAHWLFLRCYRR